MSEQNRLVAFWKEGKADKPLKWAAILLGCGIALMALSDLNGSAPPETEQETEKPAAAEMSVKEEYETELTAALNQIAGTKNVSVVVNLASSERKILEKNSSSTTGSSDETKEEEMAVVRSGDAESPVILETRKPAIQGVLVVAEGAGKVKVKKRIMEAVTRVLGVPAHRVAIMPGKTEGIE